MSEIARPPYDPALDAVLTAMAATAADHPPERILAMGAAAMTPQIIGALAVMPLTAESLPAMRAFRIETLELLTAAHAVEHEEHLVPGYEGAEIAVSVFRPAGGTRAPAPCLLHLHGGGMVCGDRHLGISRVLPFTATHGAVVATVEYRLAPEFPDPVPVEDCYAALVWLAQHAEELGIDPQRLVVEGTSAGGGLAAGVALLARDREGPRLAAQALSCPMLDDRVASVSAQQFLDRGVWQGTSNVFCWTALLGDRRGTDAVSLYAAPARATDLSGLPPAFLDVGSAEVLRDETVAYASQIWADGGVAELHVWPGGTHGFEAFAPDAAISRQASATRNAWLGRMLA